MLLYPSMLLCEAIEENPGLIPVLGRFGIRLGVGEKTIKQVADEHSINIDFFIVVLNTLLNESYFPQKKLQTFDVAQIIDYLQKTNNYYISSLLPNIEKHLRAFISASRKSNGSLEALGNLFDVFKERFLERTERDNEVYFPAILSGYGYAPASKEQTEQCEELLGEMISIIVRFLNGEYDQNLCFGVVFALNTMQRDIAQNNRIRERILYPIAASKPAF